MAGNSNLIEREREREREREKGSSFNVIGRVIGRLACEGNEEMWHGRIWEMRKGNGKNGINCQS